MVKNVTDPAEHILPLYMNGLSGRMLRMAPRSKSRREILFIYGHHASLERYFGVAEYLNKFGGVTMPDLPGFGGMESFHKIKEEPTLDNMADYLAAFIKLRFKNKKITLIGYSLGFMIITRMLQKYPELTKKVDLLASIVGFTNSKDFRFSKFNFFICRYGTALLSGRGIALFIRYVALQGIFIRTAYWLVERRHIKLRGYDRSERNKRIIFEIKLWQSNEVRTYMKMANTMLKLNLKGKHVNLPVYHVSVDSDRYFNNVKVEEHMREIYKDFHVFRTKFPTHSPTVVASAKEVEPFVPPGLRRLLRKNND